MCDSGCVLSDELLMNVAVVGVRRLQSLSKIKTLCIEKSRLNGSLGPPSIVRVKCLLLCLRTPPIH